MTPWEEKLILWYLNNHKTLREKLLSKAKIEEVKSGIESNRAIKGLFKKWYT